MKRALAFLRRLLGRCPVDGAKMTTVRRLPNGVVWIGPPYCPNGPHEEAE